MPAERASQIFARNLSWLIRHINGETLTKIAEDTDHSRNTISAGVKAASEQMVEYAQGVLMKDVFPLVTELYREALQAEIKKVKEGKELDWKLVDKLLKGLQIVDRPVPQTNLPIQPGSGQLGEGFDTLAGFVAQRNPPPRIQDRPQPKQIEHPLVDGDVVESNPVAVEEKE